MDRLALGWQKEAIIFNPRHPCSPNGVSEWIPFGPQHPLIAPDEAASLNVRGTNPEPKPEGFAKSAPTEGEP